MVEICTHRVHFKFNAKRLTYRGRGNYDYSYFTVYSHHRSLEKAKSGTLCVKNYGYYESIGTAQENDLILVR